MPSLTPMERQLLRTVQRLEAEAAGREARLTQRIADLSAHVEGLSKSVGQLHRAYKTLTEKWDEESG